VSSVVSLFLLSQVFLIITHVPLVHILASIILTGDMDIFSQGASEKLALYRVAQVSGVAVCTLWVSGVIIWNCLMCSVKNCILL